MTKKKAPDAEKLRLEFEYWCRVRHAHEGLWRELWDSILDPFERVRVYCSKEERAKRDKIVRPWQEAKDAMNAAKYGGAE